MRKLLRPFLFLVCTLAVLAAGCGKNAGAPMIEPVQYPGWIEVKLDPDARFSVPSVFFEETEAIRKKMEAEETDPYVKALLEKDRAQYSKKGSIVLVTTDQGAAFLEAGNHAARITFQTVGSPMKLPRYGQNLGMDEKALQEFGTATMDGIKFSDGKGLPDGYTVTYSNWSPMKTEIINGVEHLFTAYDKTILQEGVPLVTVHTLRWTFLNNDRIHILTASYPKEEEAYWNDDGRKLRNIVRTLAIIPSKSAAKDSFLDKVKALLP